MGGKFSSGCAATYVFVLRHHPTSSTGDTKSESYRYTASLQGDGKKSFDSKEAEELLHRSLSDVEEFINKIRCAIIDFSKCDKSKKKSKFNINHKCTPSPSLLYVLPSELDIVDVFKRLKLAINYIAKLKYHLYEPNASELIHIVFLHLATLIDVCRSYSIYHPNLPSRTILPLLSRDSIRLLQLTLISQEIDLWKSLGKAWTVPRDEWKGGDSLWNPVLLEGWEACYPPNGNVTHSRPSSGHSHHRNGNTESDTFLSEGSHSFSTARTRLS